MSAHPTTPGTTTRLIVDASTLIRWSGPPVGIVRVEAELVRYVLDHEPDAIVSVYDTRCGRFRPLNRTVARALIEGRGVVEVSLLPDPRPIERSALGRLGRRAGRTLQPLLKVRRTLAAAADECGRKLNDGALRTGVGALRDLLLDRRLRLRLGGDNGERRDLFRLDAVLGPALDLGPGDTVLSAGLDWNHKNIDAIAELKRQSGFRLAMMGYDLIPIVFPRFYAARDVDVFTRFFRAAVGAVDRFICISKRTAADFADFARAQGATGLDLRIERLGADAGRQGGGAAPLPASPASGRYVLFVSTIEPRKNHALLLRVWKRLATGEAGGTNGFKLVFAGRRGWMTEDVVASMTRDPVLARDIVHVPDADDEALHALYANAAFCVYPSLYEGFGLPVIEAFSHGKPVIASTGGALPEAAGDLAPCLDSNDDEAWLAILGRWINDPELVAERQRRIVAGFSWPTWTQAAARIIAAAREP